MTKTTLRVGDTVRYRGDFLRSIGAYSGPLGWARGTVTELQTLSTNVARPRWKEVSNAPLTG